MSIKTFLLAFSPVVALASPQGGYGYGWPPSPPLTTDPASSSSLVPNYTTTVTSTLDPTQCPISITITPNASIITTTVFPNASDPTVTVTSSTNFTTTSYSNFTTTAVSTTTSISTEISATTIVSTATPSSTSYIVLQGFNALGCPVSAVDMGSPLNFQQIVVSNQSTGCFDLTSVAYSYSILDVPSAGPPVSESCKVRVFPGTGCSSSSDSEIAQSTQNMCQDYAFQSFLLNCSGT
ncbi:hypothetical protein Tdes44962_MAKER07130 [Teratosphaeria destructans]|uniref:Uncharacterized protein n=1 Tax=Teratosphaeria destructans TaxID=418781 RepID=A0A9W7T0A2_9PEZI|nr:hypothetical protein Tdes44962_MAKER07130 [Teratosphaeria destructans]